jgi:hypothetical protein
MGLECRRLGDHMIAELKSYLKGEPLVARVQKQQVEMMS